MRTYGPDATESGAGMNGIIKQLISCIPVRSASHTCRHDTRCTPTSTVSLLVFPSPELIYTILTFCQWQSAFLYSERPLHYRAHCQQIRYRQVASNLISTASGPRTRSKRAAGLATVHRPGFGRTESLDDKLHRCLALLRLSTGEACPLVLISNEKL